MTGTQNIPSTRAGQNGSATAAVHSSPEQMTRPPIKLKLYQLRMLHAQRFKTKQQKKLPGLTVTIDTRGRTVTFDGKESEVTKAVKTMHDLVDKMKSRTLKMPAEQIRVMRGITMITQMVGVFKEKGIVAVYAAEGDTTLGVYAHKQNDLTKAIKMIKIQTGDHPCVVSSYPTFTPCFAIVRPFG